MNGKNVLTSVLVFFAAVFLFSPLACAAFNVTAIRSSQESDFRIVDVTQIPDRVFPGDEVNLKMSLYTTKTGGVSNVVVTVITPFDDITSTTTFDSVISGEKKTVTRDFTVSAGTKPGTYFVYAYASASSIPQQEVVRIPITVYEPSVIDMLFAEVEGNETVRTGAAAPVVVKLTNTGVLDAEDVVVKIILNTSSPFTPLEYDRRYVDRVEAGKTVEVPFLIGIQADASPGFYPLVVNIQYSVDNAVQPTIQQNIGLKVQANSQLLVTSDLGSGSSSSTLLTLTIANVGDTALRGVYVTASGNGVRITGVSDKFVGTLNLDDSTTMALNFVLSGRVADGASAPSITVLVSYKDPLNQESVLKQVIPLQANSTAAGAQGPQAVSTSGQRFVRPGQDSGFLGVGWLQWGLSALIVASGILYWWFKLRKKKTAERVSK